MSNKNIKTPIFRTLDGIRGIAALLVMVRHVPFFGTWNFQESYLAVDLFFILSGVVIANAYQERLLSNLSPAQFVWMRIVRIYPLYLLGCIITVMYWLAIGKSPEGIKVVIAVSAFLLIPNLGSRNNPFPLNGPAWSLFSEMLANILYAYTVRWLSRKMLVAIMGTSLAWMVFILWRHHNLDIGYYTRDIPPSLCRVAYSFSAGVLIWKLFCAGEFQRYGSAAGAKFVPWIILAIVGLVLSASPQRFSNTIFDLLCVSVGFPALVFVAMIFSPGRASAPVFKFLGMVSYPVYALHSPLSRWIPLVFRDSGVELTTHPLWIGITFAAILLPMCWFLDKYFDIPLRQRVLPIGSFYLAKLRGTKLATSK